MKLTIALAATLAMITVASPANGELVKIHKVLLGDGKTVKLACSETLQSAQNEVVEQCSSLDGKILDWELHAKPVIIHKQCDVVVIGSCDAPL